MTNAVMYEDEYADPSYWIIFIFVGAFAWYFFKKDSHKPFNSDVYSSWEEQKIDELETDVAFLADEIDKIKNHSHYY